MGDVTYLIFRYMLYISSATSVCRTHGAHHHKTFDETLYDFQGKCMYTMAKSKASFETQFEVVVKNVESFWNEKVSMTREVYIYVDYGGDDNYVSTHSFAKIPPVGAQRGRGTLFPVEFLHSHFLD